MEIKKGDIVQLKSGGPQMTVEGFKWNPFAGKYDTDEVLCSWFKGDEKQTSYSAREALKIIA